MQDLKRTELRERNRNPVIDIMRGIGILLVIVGHTYTPKGIEYIICAFHMPLFFLISGYLFNIKRPFLLLLKKSAKRLLLPYAIAGIAILIIQCIISFYNSEDIGIVFIVWLKAIIYGLPGRNLAPNVIGIERIGAIWFLQALFWAQLLIKALSIINYRAVIITILIVLNALVISTSDIIWIPFNIGTGIAAALFLYIGVILRDLNAIDRLKPNSVWAWIAFIGLALVALADRMIGKPFVIAYLQYPLFGIDIFGGLCGTYLVFLASCILNKYLAKIAHILETIGKSSNNILCVHIVELDCFYMWINLLSNGVVKLVVRYIIDIPIGLIISKVQSGKVKEESK